MIMQRGRTVIGWLGIAVISMSGAIGAEQGLTISSPVHKQILFCDYFPASLFPD